MEKQLPNNWVESYLGEILQLKNGFAFKSKNYLEEGIPVLRISEIKDEKISLDKAVFVKESVEYEKYIVEKGDILIAMSGATTGKYGLYENNEKAYQNQRVGNLRLYSNELINKKFVYYLIGALKKEIEDKAYGGAQPNISSKLIENTKFNLPPLKEQERIAQKLDALFAQLDDVKSRLETIPELLKKFRQSVLNQAVTGKLTEEWRKGEELENVDVISERNDNYDLKDLPKTWIHSVIRNIGDVKGGKRLPKGEALTAENTGFPYIRARDLKQGTVLSDNLLFLRPETQEKIKRYIVTEGDAYITIVGAKIGDAGLIPKEMNLANLTENAAKITNMHKGINNKFLSIWLRSEICQKNIQDTIMSAAQGKLALSRIKELPIYVPSLLEQNEIVKRVQVLLSKADQINQRYEVLVKSIETLPQAMLAKAFKGELVEQLPSDGDAKVLLEEIKELKKAAKQISKSSPRKKSQLKNKSQFTKKNKIKLLKQEIKKILKDKKDGFDYGSLKKELLTDENDINFKKILKELMDDGIVSQYFDKNEKQMMIKINL